MGFRRRFPVKKTATEAEAKPKPNKWKNKKVELDGYEFDSGIEAKRYIALRDDPDVTELEVHPPFDLLPAYRDPHTGYLHRKVEYRSDFKFRRISTGLTYVLDVKGVKLDTFIIKFKLAVQKYPQYVWQAQTAKGVDVFAPPRKSLKRKIA